MPMNEIFKALADNTRREILLILSKGNLTAGEIADEFAISKPSISHHLNSLKLANLVSSQRQGQHIVYSINSAVLLAVQVWLASLVDKPTNA